MKPKTIALLAAVGGGLYLANRAKKMAEAVGVAMAPPLPASSGPIVNGLSAYELAGFGKSFKSAVSHVTSAVPRPVAAVLTAGGSEISRTVIQQGKKVDASVFRNTRLGNRLRPQTQTEPGSAEPIYQDADGKVITKAQYDAIIAENARLEAEMKRPLPYKAPPPGYRARPNEELNITSTDSSDYGGTQHTASSAGSPALPMATTSVETPAPVIDPAAPPAPKSNAPALIGTALAATAAFFAFK